MRASALFAGLLLAACASAAPPPAAPPSNTPTEPDAPLPIAGDYQAPHTVGVVCDGGDDGWCDEEATDTMTVRDAGADRIDVAIELVQTNGHTCTFEGTLTHDASAAERRWVFSSTVEEEGPCTVTLTAGEDSLELTSDGCRDYCGTRAYLDASFPFPATPRS